MIGKSMPDTTLALLILFSQSIVLMTNKNPRQNRGLKVLCEGLQRMGTLFRSPNRISRKPLKTQPTVPFHTT